MDAMACPVCTLYLREGMSMQSHLSTHPKDQVIEALVRLCTTDRTLPVASQFTQQPALISPFVQMITDQQVVLGRQQVTNVFQPQIPQLMSYPLYQQHYLNTCSEYVEADQTVTPEDKTPDIEGPAEILKPGAEEIEDSEALSPEVIVEGIDETPEPECTPDDLTVQKTEGNSVVPESPPLTHPQSPLSQASNHSGITVRTDLTVSRGKFYDQFDNTDCEFHDEDARHSDDMVNLEAQAPVYCEVDQPGQRRKSENNEEDESGSEVNIQSDELMPPSGEISGQEPHSYAVVSVWISEDGPVTESDMWIEQHKDTKKRYQCLYCNDDFKCPKERRLHIANVHSNATDLKKVVPVPSDSKESMCVECGQTLPDLKSLKEHTRIHHKKLKRECGVCHEVFATQELYSDHLTKVHPLECTTCGKTFTTKTGLALHSKIHLAVKPHPCTLCSKSFITAQKLREHMNGHTGYAPLQCSMCDKTFKRYSNLKQHKDLSHFKFKRKAKEYFCGCGESFPTIKKLKWHEETHATKPKQCMYCNERYIHSSSLTRHIRKSHDKLYLPPDENIKAKNVECQVCHLVFLETSLKAHMRQHMVNKPYGCIICGKRFRTKWNLHLHRWTHAARISKPYKCTQCKAAFIRLTDHQAHVRSHYGQKPFTCNFCGMKFNRKPNCIRHEKEHTQEKNFTCKDCGKSFHRSYYLIEHSRIHTGIKPYTCHVCNKTSATKSNHNKHLKTHHAREPVNTEN